MYRCEKCCQEFPNFKWRLILQVGDNDDDDDDDVMLKGVFVILMKCAVQLNVCDPWGSVWQTCFQEAAEQVLQENAQTVGELHMQNVSLPPSYLSSLSYMILLSSSLSTPSCPGHHCLRGLVQQRYLLFIHFQMQIQNGKV